jgi:hypothetical protein
MSTTILPTAFTIASNIDDEAGAIKTALALIDDVLMGMQCDDKDDVIDAQGKLLFLLRGLPDRLREIQLEALRLADECRVLPSEAA